MVARKLATIDPDPKVVEYETLTPLSSLFGLQSASPAQSSLGDIARSLENGTWPRLYYLYQR
ncbi:MAG: hypothetical protein ACYS47_03150 [Planctomycetota bacterium]|jgi:hypothetical protein